MATHDYIISNASGAAVRADLNNALAAIATNNSSATEPTTTYAYQWWADTGSSPTVMKLRNAANSGWITLFQLDGEWTVVPFENGTAAAPSIYFKDSGTDTGIYSPGTDQVAITTGGTARLYVGSTGSVGIGSTPSYSFHVTNSSNAVIACTNSTDSATGVLNAAGGGTINVGTASNHPLTVSINSTEAFRVDTSRRLLVGTSSARTTFFNGSQAPALQLEGTGSARMLSVFSNNTDGGALILGRQGGSTAGGNTLVANNDEIGIISFQASDGTDPTECARIQGFIDGTPGNNDTPGRLVFSTTADGASSPTERMRITNGGTVTIGSDGNTTLFNQASITGAVIERAGAIQLARSGDQSLLINRITNDGTLVGFYQDGTQEGSISVSGTTVSYNGAHLSRWSQLPSGQERTEILRGSVLSNIDEMCEWANEENEQLNRMKVSDTEGDKNVSGVFQAWDDDDDTYTNDFYCAMTGDFIIRIAAGVTVERGDLLMSAGDGTAKPQDDDIIRSKTIAKVTSTNVSCTYDDGSYCVPCVLMAC